MRCTITPEIWEAIKVAHATGIPLREFARNRGMSENTVLSYAKRHGLTQEIQRAKTHARDIVQSNALSSVQSVTTTMVQRGQRYVERMAGVTEKVLPYLEKMQPEDLLEKSDKLLKYNQVSRVNYGLNDSTGPGGSLSIEVLTNQVAVRVSKN